MAELITVDELMTLIGGTFSADDEDVLQMYLDFAVGELETYLGRPVTIQEFTEDVVPDASGDVFLSQTPVHSISSIQVDGVESEPYMYTVTPWGFKYAAHPSNFYLGYSTYESFITVTYEAGLDTPASVNSVIANVIIRQWNERVTQANRVATGTSGLAELRVEDYARKFHDQSGSNMYAVGANAIHLFRHDGDFLPVRRYKRRSFA